ncbi:MAG: hypothetical protein JWP41_443 [Ramlibacter sp.]|nr:hypothetical protein [Ramlibacter sp.]
MLYPPSPAPSTTLRIGERLTTVRTGAPADQDSCHSLAVGFMSPGQALRHRPPTPQELENAIAAIEDAVMPLARAIPASTQLATADPMALRLCDLAAPFSIQGGLLEIGAVEALFNDMVDVSQGRPSAGSPFLDTGLCGYLLILREFMHHLAFSTVIVEAESAPAACTGR